jgi:histidyl-tRNA synthetase
MMSGIKPISGFPEWLPQEKVIEEDFLEKIRSVFRLHGFCPIETPAVERAGTLIAKGGNEKEIYKIGRLHAASDSSESGDNDLALHFDLTVPMARYIAQHEHYLTFPFRRYQIQPVWRGERAQAGRFRQFYQCDIDIVGRGALPLSCDAEIPAVMAGILRALDIGEFQIRINNRKILQGFLSGIGIGTEYHHAVMGCVDKLEKIGEDAVIEEVRSVLGDSGFDVSKILSFLSKRIALREVADLVSVSTDELYRKGVAELAEVVDRALAKGVLPDELVIDLSIARGLDYYTGTVFETRLVRYPEVGSVCSGGRYENLVGSFAEGNFPGVGMSIGLTRLLSQLFRYEVVKSGAQAYTKILIVPLASDAAIDAYAEGFASQLRGWGVSCEISLIGGNKVVKHIEYATKKGIPFVGFIGETELADGTVAMKDLQARTQENILISNEGFFRRLHRVRVYATLV